MKFLRRDVGAEGKSQGDGRLEEMIVQVLEEDPGNEVAEHQTDPQTAQGDHEELADRASHREP